MTSRSRLVRAHSGGPDGSARESFTGLKREGVEFLRELGIHNSRAWFNDHREQYQRDLIEPLRRLVTILGPAMLEIDSAIDITPAVGRTISRINRDIRFSRDKSPYRSSMWVTFKRRGEDLQDVPTWFFELSPNSWRYGMGWYAASPQMMSALRSIIDEAPRSFLATVRQLPLDGRFVLAGDKYARPIGEEKPAAIREWYQRKNLYLVRNEKVGRALFVPKLADTLRGDFTALRPAYRLLQKAVDRCRASQQGRSEN